MKLIKIISHPVVVAVLGLLAFSAAANAVSITIECKVAGYSTAGWIEVRNGSNTGGRVQRDSAGRYYTDRVQGGEPLRVTYQAQTVDESWRGAKWGGIYKLDPSTGHTTPYPGATFTWVGFPYVLTAICPMSPDWRNLWADVKVNFDNYSDGYFRKEIPVGTR